MSAAALSDTLKAVLHKERLRGGRLVNALRAAAVVLFCGLALVEVTLLKDPEWLRRLYYLVPYALIAVTLYFFGRRSDRIARLSSLSIAILDVPGTFMVQSAALEITDRPGSVAGFTLGVLGVLVVMSALSLDVLQVVVVGVCATVAEVILQDMAHISMGGITGTLVVMPLYVVACGYAGWRLRRLIEDFAAAQSEREQIQMHLIFADRLVAIGTLAASVAHEINNPLAYVLGNLELVQARLASVTPQALEPGLERNLSELRKTAERVLARINDFVKLTEKLPPQLTHDLNNIVTPVHIELELFAHVLPNNSLNLPLLNEVKSLLAQAREGTERVRRIAESLKNFSHPNDEVLEAVAVEAVLRSVAGMAEPQIRPHGTLHQDLGETPLVLVNAASLSQVFLNLLVNAGQALLPDQKANNVVQVRTYTDPEGRAVVAIRDSGTGIPVDIQPRIFAPFFTTKPSGVGTGIGLSISRTIVRRFGGEITFESKVNRGTTFYVTLPAHAVAQAQPPSAAAAAASSVVARAMPKGRRRGTILVVDDDTSVAEMICRVLEDTHDVLLIHDPQKALEMLRVRGNFDVILCDMMMPQLTGLELHAQVAQFNSAIADRFVFLTGGSAMPDIANRLAALPNQRLDKPFNIDALIQLVDGIVNAR